MRQLFLGLVIVIFSLNSNVRAEDINSQAKNLDNNNTAVEPNFYKISKETNEFYDKFESKKSSGYKPFKRWEWFWESRVNPDGSFPNIYEAYKELDKEKNVNKSEFLAGKEWQLVGPKVKPSGRTGVGRINCVGTHPTSRNTFYVGAAGGGIWKTTNKGSTWETFFIENWNSISISDIKVAKSNPEVVYAATGDAHTYGVASGGAYGFYSIGLVKTTNGGDSWEKLDPWANGNATQQSNKFIVKSIAINPNNENEVVFSSNSGLYRTVNGGKDWSVITFGAFGDMVMHPTNSDIIYAVEGYNAYATSTKISTFNIKTEEKLFTKTYSDCSRIELAVSKDNPDMVLALLTERATQQGWGFRGIERSGDMGENWKTIKSKATGAPNYLGITESWNSGSRGQGYYDLALAVDPKNQDRFYIGGINTYRSEDGGDNLEIITDGYTNRAQYVHPDIQVLETNFFGDIIGGNDGGVYLSVDRGESWTDISSGITATQYYKIGQSSTTRNLIIAGAQDNGTHLFEKNSWKQPSGAGGDGMQCLIKEGDDNIMIAASQNGTFRRSTNGGLSFSTILNQQAAGEYAAWSAPVAHDPNNPQNYYFGYQNVIRSTNSAAPSSFQKISDFKLGGSNTLRCITVSKVNSNIIYASSRGTLFHTTNAGGNWSTLFTSSSNISDIETHPTDKDRIWITLSGYSNNSKVLELNNGEVINLSDGLPNFNVNTIVYQDGSPDRMYVGTDAGVYTRDKNSSNWSLFNEGMPRVVVSDLMIQDKYKLLRAGTYGVGIWEIELLDCNLAQPTINSSVEVSEDGKIHLCSNQSVDLTAKGIFEIAEWSDGQKGQKITVNKSGTYFVTVTDVKGCIESSETIEVEVEEMDDYQVKSSSFDILCEGDSLRLRTFGTKLDFLWNTGETGNSIYAKESGEYYYKITNPNNTDCFTYSDTLSIDFEKSPGVPEITVKDEVLHAPISEEEAYNYQWYYFGEEIEGATESSYEPIIGGIHTVLVENAAGCSGESENFNVNWLSLEELDGDIVVSPNPNDGKFLVSMNLNSLSDIELTVVNVHGERIYRNDFENRVNSFNENINLKNLSKGVYFLKISINSDMMIKKIIVQ